MNMLKDFTLDSWKVKKDAYYLKNQVWEGSKTVLTS